MGLFGEKQKPRKEPKQSYYIEPKTENPEQETHEVWVEQENDK
jgi:hypothetical protein